MSWISESRSDHLRMTFKFDCPKTNSVSVSTFGTFHLLSTVTEPQNSEVLVEYLVSTGASL